MLTRLLLLMTLPVSVQANEILVKSLGSVFAYIFLMAVVFIVILGIKILKSFFAKKDDHKSL